MTVKIGIVGGGIGGLTTAISLQKMNYEVKIYERTPTLRTAGAGLMLGANALKALRKLAIDHEVMQKGKFFNSFHIYDERGEVLSQTRELPGNQFELNSLSIHRADLHDILSKHLLEGTIITNKKCEAFTQSQDGVTLFFEDGSEEFCHFVIAADGVHSIFRRKLVPDSSPRYAGYTCWRAVINNHGDIDDESVSETWGVNGRFGIVPLSENRIYWYACMNAPSNSKEFADYRVKDLQKTFNRFHNPIPQLLNQTSEEALIHNDIIDIKPIKNFAFHNILLLGDAAHATTPNMGQGAGQSIEDAVILLSCIHKDNDLLQAFQMYEKERVGRTSKIIKMSRSIGKVAHLTNPLLVFIRNQVLKHESSRTQNKRIDFLYDVDFD